MSDVGKPEWFDVEASDVAEHIFVVSPERGAECGAYALEDPTGEELGPYQSSVGLKLIGSMYPDENDTDLVAAIPGRLGYVLAFGILCMIQDNCPGLIEDLVGQQPAVRALFDCVGDVRQDKDQEPDE